MQKGEFGHMDSNKDSNEEVKQNPMGLINDFFQAKPNRSLLHSIDAYFGHFQENRGIIIPVEVVDTKTHYIVSAVLTGISKNDIELNLIQNQLRISVNEEGTKQDTHSYKKNSKYNDRIIDLPFGLNINEMKAVHRDGILKIKFPKKKGRKIEIE